MSIAAQTLKRKSKPTLPWSIESCLGNIRKLQPELNAFISLTPEAELSSQVQALQERDAQGESLPLLNIPVAIKDNICVKGSTTTCASKMLSNFVSPYSATAVELLQNSGALIVGKTNMDEFGMGSLTKHSFFGPTRHHLGHFYAGGSSGGSAVAVASQMASMALGSDTGGSVRIPASYCGVVGFKPTYGSISRWGLVAYASSLDTIGTMTRTVEDTKRLFKVLSKYDHKDPSSIPPDERRLFHQQQKALQPLRSLIDCSIGIPEEYILQEIMDQGAEAKTALLEAIEQLERYGAQVKLVSLPHTRYALPTYYIIALGEASSNLARYDGKRYGFTAKHPELKDHSAHIEYTRSLGFGPEVQKRVLMGAFVLTAGSYQDYFMKAQHYRECIRSDFSRVFEDEQVDALLTPTTFTTAPPIQKESGKSKDNQEETLHEYLNDVFTVPASLSGLPALSIPARRSPKSMPLGLQLIGRRGHDERLLQLSSLLEQMFAGKKY